MKTFIQFLLVALAGVILSAGCNKDQKENENIEQLTLAVNLDSASGCKNFQTDLKTADTSKFLSCIDYKFDIKNNVLFIKHINAGFNCCPVNLHCKISTVNDTLFIEEVEPDGGCYCLCLFDLFIQVSGIGQNKYIVKFIEPYCKNQEKLIFEMDLTKFNSGKHCVQRNKYPWG